MVGSMKDAFEEAEKAKKREVEVFAHEISLMRQIIAERAHPLDLLRELISNSAAREVQATEIEITCYLNPKYGWVFTVEDDGIGMDYTGSILAPGRLDRFLAFGLSSVVGLPSDEFSFKGLGSKLAYQSRSFEVETWTGKGDVLRVVVNEPWETILAGRKPKPTIFSFSPEANRKRGTKITVCGHPPHKEIEEFTFEEIKNFLLHRTFVGFTRPRERVPKITLKVGGVTEVLPFGFPVLKNIQESSPEGTVFIKDLRESSTIKGTNKALTVTLKGIYSLEAYKYGVNPKAGADGIILSILGIPYFSLPLREYAPPGGLAIIPGPKNVCLIAECDGVQGALNISRSGLNDTPERDAFEKCLKSLLEKIGSSDDYKRFIAYARSRKEVDIAEEIANRKTKLQSDSQEWVYFEDETGKRRLHRKPENEKDTLAILWKLEGMKKLPFYYFESLEHGSSGPDIIAHLQETERSEREDFITIEFESQLTHFKEHHHIPAQQRTIICWDIGKSRKIKVKDTDLPYKIMSEWEGIPVRIYLISRFPGITTSRK